MVTTWFGVRSICVGVVDQPNAASHAPHGGHNIRICLALCASACEPGASATMTRPASEAGRVWRGVHGRDLVAYTRPSSSRQSSTSQVRYLIVVPFSGRCRYRFKDQEAFT